MLIENGSHLYAYAITRDFGFAPNPFYGFCTLATCKPKIRKGAKVGDWILGIGGCNLKEASRKCILLMKVTDKISFQEYWDNPNYSIKKSLRNGSRVRMLGDNIYHKDSNNIWIQEDSHHSNPDGTINTDNLRQDTQTESILISNYFLYFGDAAVDVDLSSIGYHNAIRDCKKNTIKETNNTGILIKQLVDKYHNKLNMVISDPCQFEHSDKRVDQVTGKLS